MARVAADRRRRVGPLRARDEHRRPKAEERNRSGREWRRSCSVGSREQLLEPNTNGDTNQNRPTATNKLNEKPDNN